VARRLALVARARVYGEAGLVCSGPELDRVAIDGCVARNLVPIGPGPALARARGRDRLRARGRRRHLPRREREARRRSRRRHQRRGAGPRDRPLRLERHGRGSLENDAGLPALSFRTDGAPARSGRRGWRERRGRTRCWLRGPARGAPGAPGGSLVAVEPLRPEAAILRRRASPPAGRRRGRRSGRCARCPRRAARPARSREPVPRGDRLGCQRAAPAPRRRPRARRRASDPHLC
jgi:hypothetical protein